MANTEFQLQVARVPDEAAVSVAAYDTPAASFIFIDPVVGAKLYESVNLTETGGAFAGEEIEITVLRNGSSAVNTETRKATAILLHLAIPTRDATA